VATARITRRTAFPLAAALMSFAVAAIARGEAQRATSRGESCRIFAAAYTMRQTGSANPSFAGTTTGTCTFSAAALEVACTTRYSDTLGTSTTSSSIATYTSLEDMVEEVSVIPPLKRLVSVTGNTPGQSRGTTSYRYDAQKRIVEERGTATTTIYTAWDRAGRPLAATTTGGRGRPTVLAMSYNDAARTMTTVNTQAGVSTSCVQTYDTNGNQISYRCTSSAAGGTTRGTTTITETGKICR
jgi:YD repeat-containing protein